MPTIEVFTPEHIEEVLTLWRITPGVGLSSADTPPELTRFVERNPGTSFVARLGDGSDGAGGVGSIVGAIMGGWDGRRGYIHHLAVDAGSRRRGIGSALLDRLLDEFRRRKVLKVHMFVFQDNQAAIDFYAKRGWTRRQDIAMMSLNL